LKAPPIFAALKKMRRWIANSMIAVLAGWLLMPAFAARSLTCSMVCSRRSHMAHCSGMAAESDSSGLAFHPAPETCPGTCCCQLGAGPSFLGVPFFTYSPVLLVFSCLSVSAALRRASVLFAFAARAPPFLSSPIA
jgi:hypothetical protein